MHEYKGITELLHGRGYAMPLKTDDVLKVLPKQLSKPVNYEVTLSGATPIVETSKSTMRAAVMAKSLAEKTMEMQLPEHALTVAFSLLSDDQLDLIQEAERAIERADKGRTASLMKQFYLGDSVSAWQGPYDFLASCLAMGFNREALVYIRDFAHVRKATLVTTVTVCFALKEAGVEVTEENILHQLSFTDKMRKASNGWVRADRNSTQYLPEVIKAIHTQRDRISDMIAYFSDRGTLQGVVEYLSADKPMASGVL